MRGLLPAAWEGAPYLLALLLSQLFLVSDLRAQGTPLEVCGARVSPNIASDGIGPVVLGTLVPKVLAQCRGIAIAPVTSPDSVSPDTLLELAINGGHDMLGVFYRDSTVIRIAIHDSAFYTPDSLHVGTLFARLRRPGLTVRSRHGFLWATVPGRCSPRFVLGSFDQRRSEADSVLLQKQVPDTMRVSAIWLSRCQPLRL
jgi:hypothetical protein